MLVKLIEGRTLFSRCHPVRRRGRTDGSSLRPAPDVQSVMAQLLLPHAQERPQEPALTDEWGITTWSELNSRVNRLAGALRGLGLQTGDTIALHSRNRREYLELMAAAGHIGLIYVLVNWHWTADELRYVLQDSGAKALFSEQ